MICKHPIMAAATIPLSVASASGLGITAQAGDTSGLAGNWQGESICYANEPVCHDEKVIDHIPAPDASGRVFITADKLIDGRPWASSNFSTIEKSEPGVR
jgi:hypothetical protein